MRIGVDARYLNGEYSGIAKYSERLLSGLSTIDQRNEYVVYTHPGYKVDLGLGSNFTFRKFNARAVSFDTLWRFGQFIENDKLDVLHSHYPLTPILYDGPLIVTVHDLQALTVSDFTGGRPWWQRLGYDAFYHGVYSFSIRRADWLVAVSNATSQEVKHHFEDCSTRVITVRSGLEERYLQPIDDEYEKKVAAKYSLPESYILYIGSTRPNKNLMNMLRAFAKFREYSGALKNESLNELNFVLVINPDRFFTQCRDFIKDNGLEGRVKIYRAIQEEEKRVFYHRSRALFFASKNEGFGFPALEAQGCGAPAIVSTDASLPEVAGKGALYVDPDDVGAMTNALIRLMMNDDLRQRLLQAGAQNVKRFDWNQTARRMLEIYENLF